MRVVIQRVSKASVTINNKIKRKINDGLLILLGIEESDGKEDIEWLCGKITKLRIFRNENGSMNFSVKDIDGDIILVSQFTLYASTKKGNRPSFLKAAQPAIAIPLYKQFIVQLESEFDKPIHTGEFGADMKVELVNDGPVTILIDTKNRD